MMLTLVGDAERVKLGGTIVTVKGAGLLSFVVGATETTKDPELAPEGIVTVIELLLHELTDRGTPFNVTTLLPCELPKPEPDSIT
jgi:hypothetical protein